MSQQLEDDRTHEAGGGHPTTRRAFITTLGFGVVSVYGVWAAYGAVPTSLGFLTAGEGAAKPGMAGMAGMAHGGGSGMSPEEFRRLTYGFIDANSLPDGSVRPLRRGMAAAPEAETHGHSEGREAARHGRTSPDEHGGNEVAEAKAGHGDHHGSAPAAAPEPSRHAMGPAAMAGHHEEEAEPIDVYLMASRYGYEPAALRLEIGVRYRFRMMAVDADHGASINARFAGRMIRCPARTLVEQQLVFNRAGEYLIYCTVFCGEGHDMMMGRMTVA